MKSSFATFITLIPYALGFPHLANFPEYRSLAGLSSEEILTVMQIFRTTPGAQPLPPPISDTSAKLVVDNDHPYVAPNSSDFRGPCPGLNTLANHGYIDHSGITTPGDIIIAVQEGFNMGPQFAAFLTYSAFIVDGNQLTNMMSIGKNTTSGNIPGLDTHGTFEGDASITRNDYNINKDNYSFNQTLFQVLNDSAQEYGYGYITIEAAAKDRASRINNSIQNNPGFFYKTPRFLGATAETGFALAMFVSDQTEDITLPLQLEDALSFFSTNKFPEGFIRRQTPYEFPLVKKLTYELVDLVGVLPGQNVGTTNNYIINPNDPHTFCYFYQQQAGSVFNLYGPNPPSDFLAALKANLNTYYYTLGDTSCEQVFPYGM